jgi:type I restriction enzyme S subunit
MKSNYEMLGKYIRQVDVRNRDLSVDYLLGLSINKGFIPSIANTVGTEFDSYKIVRTGQFAYGPVTSRNSNRITIARLEDRDCIISSSYSVFEVTNTDILMPEYLMLWLKRPEFDRYARFKSHGSVREIFDWDELCNVSLPVPDIDSQQAIVRAYNTVERRIKHLRQINDNLEAVCLSLYLESSKLCDDTSKLSSYCNFQEGYVNPPQEYPEYFDGNIRWLRGVDFNDSVILSTSRTLTQKGFDSAGKSAYLFPPNTIAITKSGTIGKLGIIGDFMCGNRATINIHPKSDNLLPFIYFFMKSIQSKFWDMAVGSAQVNLYVSVLAELDCPLYSLAEFAKFNKIANIALSAMINNVREIETLGNAQTLVLNDMSIL